MESTKKSRNLFILNQGAWMGLALAGFSYLLHLMNMMQATGGDIFSWVIYGFFIYFSIKLYRDRYLGGAVSYGTALWAGTRVGLFAGIVMGAYLFLYIKFIHPAFLEEMVATIQETYLQSGMSGDQVENLSEIISMSANPVVLIISGVLSTGFSAFVLSLLFSALLKKEGDPFGDAMKNVE